MMKNLTVLILLSISLLSFSQERFNYIHENQTYPFIQNIHPVSDTGYVGIGGNYYNNQFHIDVNYFDLDGNYIWNKHYGDDTYNYYHGVENACIRTDGGYILAGSSSALDTHMIYLVKFNEVFDTLWTKKYFKDTNWVTSRGICNTDDGGFLIVGETELNNDSIWGSINVKGLMLKVDANGNYQWFKSFGTEDYNDYLYKAAQTHDGGYLVGGATNSWQNSLNYIDRGDWYIIKTDSQGNEEWNRTYGNPIYKDGRISDILRASDTTYYITGSWTYDRNSTGSYLYKESYVVKLDEDFNEVYELKYDNQAYYKGFPMAAIETEDSNIVLVGHRVWNSAWRSTMHKITPDGEVLWERQYVAGNDTTNAASYAMSVKQTADGGFVFGGWVDNQYLNPNQQMWLVKTDEYGCDDTGDFWDCATNIMHNEFVDNPSFEMYPNPAKDFVVLNYRHSEQSEGISNLTVEIYNIAGRLVKSSSTKQFPKSTDYFTNVRNDGIQIDISKLEKGVYIVRVGKQTKKLIVE